MNEDLIDKLTRDLEPVELPLPIVPLTLAWLFASTGYVVVLTALLGPFRPGFESQLLETPRYLFEMLLGLSAFVCFAFVAFRTAVPGLNSKLLSRAGLVLTIGWLSQFVAGFEWPVLEPSMLGKRDHCAFEAYLYSVPPAVAAIWLQSRRYALAPMKAALYAAVASGMLPALVMQVACMYEPEHILKFHVLPIAILSGAVGVVTFFLARKLNR